MQDTLRAAAERLRNGKSADPMLVAELLDAVAQDMDMMFVTRIQNVARTAKKLSESI